MHNLKTEYNSATSAVEEFSSLNFLKTTMKQQIVTVEATPASQVSREMNILTNPALHRVCVQY